MHKHLRMVTSTCVKCTENGSFKAKFSCPWQFSYVKLWVEGKKIFLWKSFNLFAPKLSGCDFSVFF